MALIPYFVVPSLHLGFLGAIEPFGVFVVLGIFTAYRIALMAARKDGRSIDPLIDFAFWGVLWGVVGGHLFHLFFYHPEDFAKGPLQLFRIWDGLSSTGGVIGGVAAAIIYFRRHKVPLAGYTDAFALGMAPGWAIARLGCFSVHDHPGVLTHFFLAVNFPEGPRHDLGLDDAIWLFAIAAVLFVLRRKGLLKGKLLAVLSVMYAVGRFGFDFLRARDLPYADARYWGLTPAQYACFFLFAYGVYALIRRPSPSAVATPPEAGAAPQG